MTQVAAIPRAPERRKDHLENMQRKRVVLHIGAHKTGTTSVQHFFAEHEKDLAAAGILYPRSGRHHYAQHRLAFALKGRRVPGTELVPDVEQEAAGLRDEIARSPCRTVLISSEEFFSLRADRIAPLRQLFADHDVEVLAVLRRPDSLFASVYNQKAKEPRNRFVKSHEAFMREPVTLSPDLAFEQVLEAWSRVFGSDAMRVRCLEQFPNAVVLVSQLVGFSLGIAAVNLPHKNVSATVRAAELMRLGKATAQLSEVQLRALRTCADEVFGATGRDESLLAPQERLQLLRNLDPMVDRVFKRFVGTENIYASKRFQASDFPERTTLRVSDLMDVIAALLSTPATR